MMRSKSLALTFMSIGLGTALGVAVSASSSSSAAPKSPAPAQGVDPGTAKVQPGPAKTVAGATTFMSAPTVAQLAKVPEAKLAAGIVLGPDTPLLQDASIIFNCASLVQPRFEDIPGHALFHGTNKCGGYGTGALVWFKAQRDEEYMVECAGTAQKWRLIENRPGALGQDTTFATATSRPWIHIRPAENGWHGVAISAPEVAWNESYTLTRCRVTPLVR